MDKFKIMIAAGTRSFVNIDSSRVKLMRGVGFEPTNPYGMRFPSQIISSERHVRIDLTPLTKLGNPRTIIHPYYLHLSN
jgi:hypothetical protein